MLFNNWNHPEIELYNQERKKDNTLLTFRFHNSKDKYFYILSGEPNLGFNIMCLVNFNKNTSGITRFVHFYIQEELKKYLYKSFPSLELKEAFSNKSYVNASFEPGTVHLDPYLKTYLYHFLPMISYIAFVSLIFSISLFFIFNFGTKLFLIFFFLLTISFFFANIRHFSSCIVESQIFKQHNHSFN